MKIFGRFPPPHFFFLPTVDQHSSAQRNLSLFPSNVHISRRAQFPESLQTWKNVRTQTALIFCRPDEITSHMAFSEERGKPDRAINTIPTWRQYRQKYPGNKLHSKRFDQKFTCRACSESVDWFMTYLEVPAVEKSIDFSYPDISILLPNIPHYTTRRFPSYTSN